MDEKIKAVFFDLDGTLVNAYLAICSSFAHVMQTLKLPRVSDEDVIRSVGWGERKLFESFVPTDRIDEALEIYRPHHVKALADHAKYLPGAKELLEGLLEDGYELAVASNRPQKTSMILLEKLDAVKYFREIVCADMIGRYKPDPGLLLELLKRFKISKFEAVYVGDMALDVQTGHAAGIKTIAVTTGSSSREEIEAEDPFKTVGQIKEVGQILASYQKGARKS